MTTTIEELNKLNKVIITYERVKGGQCFIIADDNKNTIYMKLEGPEGFVKLENGAPFGLNNPNISPQHEIEIDPDERCIIIDINITWKYQTKQVI